MCVWGGGGYDVQAECAELIMSVPLVYSCKAGQIINHRYKMTEPMQGQMDNRMRTVITGHVDIVSLLQCLEAKISDCHQLVRDVLYASATMSETAITLPMRESTSQEQFPDRDAKLQDVQNIVTESCCGHALADSDSEENGTPDFGLCKCLLVNLEGHNMVSE